MFVAKQQLTSLSPPKKPDGAVGFFAVKREILSHNQLSGTPRDTVYSRGEGAHEQKSEYYRPR